MQRAGRGGRIGVAVLGLGIGAAIVMGTGTSTALADDATGSRDTASTTDTGNKPRPTTRGRSPSSAGTATSDGPATGPTRPRPKQTKVKPPKKSSTASDPDPTGAADPDQKPIARTTLVRTIAADAPTANRADSPVSPAAPVALSQLWTAAATRIRREAENAAAATTALVVSVTTSAQAALTSMARAVTDRVTSAVLDSVSALTKVIDGPPVLPPGSTVTVRTSSLTITDTMTVSANWYFPEGDQPPDRMIWLQHGFLATGPMYSYTAAWLAENTHSIVVTPTLPTNWMAPGGNGTPGSGLWVGGDAMHAVVAELFVGDRAALTASALDAGYAVQYGLDPQEAVLPRRFGLVGHSAGGALVSGVAGYLADNGAADDLVGVVALDGVPTGDQLPSALRKLADYQERTGRYIPFRNIGAPRNQFNAPGNINEALTAARPDHFNGVVLVGGAHTDAMVGGNPLIQFGMYLFCGFPQQKNTSAAQTLMADWLNEWFDGDVTDGDQLAPGSQLSISTPKGVATGTVIGAATATI